MMTRLVRLAVIAARPAACFVGPIADLEPQNWGQVVEALVAPDLDVGGQWQDPVPTVRAAGDQDVADDAADAPAGNEDPGAFAPCPVQFFEEGLVIVDPPQLVAAGIGGIGLQIEIGRLGDDEVDRFARDGVNLGVAEDHLMLGPIVRGRPSTLAEVLVGLQQGLGSAGLVIRRREMRGEIVGQLLKWRRILR